MVTGVMIQPGNYGNAHIVEMEPSLRMLQASVEGDIQIVDTDEMSFVLNEEGKLLGLPINARATAYLWHAAPEWPFQDFICGPVLIYGRGDADGDFTNVPREALDHFGLP